MSENGRVEIVYHADGQSSATRVILPLEALENNEATYVRAYCYLRGEERTFRLDRVSEAHLVPGSFDVPAGYVRKDGQTVRVARGTLKDDETETAGKSCLVWVIIVGIILIWLLFLR